MAEEPVKAAPEGEAPPAEGDVAAAAAAKKKKLLMMVSAALAVVGIIVAVGVFFIFGGKKEDAADTHAAGTEVAKMAVYDVPEFTLNLLTAEQGNGPRFLKITLALELENAADAETMGQMLPRLQDDWGGFLRQLRPTDLQGSAALQRLKEGLLRRAMQSLSPIPVKAVYIRDMLVQ